MVEDLWYKNTLIYSLDLETFMDADGDGVGDFEGLMRRERNSVRTPMQWSREPQAGFSTARRTAQPIINQGPYSYELINVESQRRDPDSLLSWTAQMIRLRKECPEIGWGSWEILETGSPAVLAMRYDWRDNSLVLIHNFDAQPHDIIVKPNCAGEEKLINLRAEEQSQADREARHHLKLEAYGYRWYRVGGLNHIIRREKA